jgi:hypothetical protein
VLVAAGQRWRFEGSGTNLGTAWREPGFDDRSWTSAPTPIYGGDAPSPGGDLKPIPTLFATGVGADGRVLAPGSPDPHYVVTASAEKVTPPPPAPALVITGHPAWLANDEGSSWLGPVEPGTASVAAGSYRVRTAFDLAGFDPATATVTLAVAADNRLNDVLLNGRSLGLQFVGFSAFSADFRINTGFVAGTNTLEFLWANDTSSPNPAGFRARLSGVARTLSAAESRLPEVTPVAYFRTPFVFTGHPAATRLAVQAFVDDGAVLYLNGAEVLRLNLPEGPVTDPTPAVTNVLGTAAGIDRGLPAGFLRAGTNVLAVALHQAAGGLNDAWFNLTLTAEPAPVGEPAPLVFNEIAPANPGFFLEIANPTTADAPLAGYRVVRGGPTGASYAFPRRNDGSPPGVFWP